MFHHVILFQTSITRLTLIEENETVRNLTVYSIYGYS